MLEVKVYKDAVIASLIRKSRAVDPPGPLLHKIGQDLADSTMRRFPEGKGPDGKKWAAKSPVTRARHPRSDTRLLIGETKTLATTIAHQVRGSSVFVGSNVVYAAVQQFGAKKGSLWQGITKHGRKGRLPWGDIPARPFLGISEKDKKEMRETVLDWIRPPRLRL